MKKYRIVVTTQRNGYKWYYPQKRNWFGLWKNLYKYAYSTLEYAQEIIKDDCMKSEKDIVKVENMFLSCSYDGKIIMHGTDIIASEKL